MSWHKCSGTCFPAEQNEPTGCGRQQRPPVDKPGTGTHQEEINQLIDGFQLLPQELEPEQLNWSCASRCSRTLRKFDGVLAGKCYDGAALAQCCWCSCCCSETHRWAAAGVCPCLPAVSWFSAAFCCLQANSAQLDEPPGQSPAGSRHVCFFSPSSSC